MGASPRVIAITPNGATAYVVGKGTVTPIVTKTGKARPAVAVGRGASAIAITPNGAFAYVLNTDSGSVTPIRTSDNAGLTPIRLDGLPRSIVISPDGQFAYVTLTRGGKRAGGFVVPIKIGSNIPRPALARHPAMVGYVPSGLDLRQPAVSPDGRTLLVGNFGSGELETVNLTQLPGADLSCLN